MDQAELTEMWRLMLTGRHRMFRRNRKFWAMLPADPRCKLCAAPFKGLGGAFAKRRGRGPDPSNPAICGVCRNFAEEMPGGADIEVTMAFADIRGSTEMAERMSPSEFARVMGEFYEVATSLLHEGDAFIDKMVGDEVIGLYLPGFSGDRHACLAIEAWTELVHRMSPATSGPTLPVGAAVHFGTAYVGTVGSGDTHTTDFTAMGSAMNTAARLVSAAGPWEVLVTRSALEKCESPPAVHEWRTLDLKGLADPVEAAVVATN